MNGSQQPPSSFGSQQPPPAFAMNSSQQPPSSFRSSGSGSSLEGSALPNDNTDITDKQRSTTILASDIQYQTAPIKVLLSNGVPHLERRSSTALSDSTETAVRTEQGDVNANHMHFDSAHEDVWEDEEEAAQFDSGNDSASDEETGDEENIGVPAYREATEQYKQSRRALLLSSLSSIASSPSAESLVNSNSPSYLLSSSRDSDESLASPSGLDFGAGVLSNGDATYDDGDRSGSRSPDMTYAELARSRHLFDSRSPSATPDILTDDDTADSPISDQILTPDRERSLEREPSEDAQSTRSVVTPRASVTRFEDLMNSQTSEDLRNGSVPTDDGDDSIEQYELAPPFEAHPSAGILSRGESYLKAKIASLQDTRSNVDKSNIDASAIDRTPFSLWDFLQEEVLATDFDSTQEMKWERVTNFISIPFWMEKIISFGFVVCLDSFLYTFTILPLRFGVAMWRWATNTASWICGGEKRYLHSSHKCDILKMLLIVFSCIILSHITDASKMYHSVRGQDVVKLSVIFNVLEIADRLCCSFGQDLLDSLFSRTTLARRKNGKQPYLRPLGFFSLSLCYVLAHTLVLFYQLVTLNVAINSYDNALLTLLLSNQFVEIKSSVFKKFEKENLFQMTCADIVERFQLTLMLSAIGLRNLIELSGGSLEGGGASPLPASFTVFPSFSLLETILTPVCIVLASECIVDWLKHAFITKFNHIRPAVYGRFMDVLCRDLVVGGPSTAKEKSRKHTFVDQSPIVSRRLGFAALPLACLLVRLILQIISMIGDTSHIDECAVPLASIMETGWVGTVARKFGAVDIDNEWIRAVDLFVRGSAWALTAAIAWIFLVAIKLLLGTNLVSFASYRYATMHEREVEENLNAKDRQPIGTDKEERMYDKRLGVFLDKTEDDAVQILVDGTHIPFANPDKKQTHAADGNKSGHGGQKKDSSLMDVSRYTMVRSRIW